MEEMYLLLDDRFNLIEEVRKKLLKICNYSEYPENLSTVNPYEVQECSQLILQIKRNDKLRIIKENELMEIVFSLRSFDPQQRERFQEKSYDLMKKIKQDFVYEKYKKTGETKDIAKLYLNFFMGLKMQTKVDDLKRAYANNKYIGYPIVSILMKWLLEISRKHFQTVIKEKGDKIFSISTKVPKPPTTSTPTTTKSKASDSRSSTSYSESPNSNPQNIYDAKYRNVVRKISKFDTKMTDENSEYPSTSIDIDDKLLNPEKMRISSEDIRQNYKSYLFDQQKYDKYGENNYYCGFSITASQYTNNLLSKNIKYMRTQPKPPNSGNVIQIIMPTVPSIQSTLDVIEDLDFTHISTVYQVIQHYKNVKKIPGGNLINIDLDKKKEALNTIYKSLYYKNTEVDKTISYYQNKLFEKNMLDYSPLLIIKKRDTYCEGYTVDFPRRFPHCFINISSPDMRPEMSPLIKRHSLNTNKRAVTAGTSAVIANRSGKSINTEWVDEKDNSRNEELELKSTKQSFSNYHDNQFRIIKKKNSFQEREDSKNKKSTNTTFQNDESTNISQLALFPTSTIGSKKEAAPPVEPFDPKIRKKNNRVTKKLSDKNRSASVNKFRADTPGAASQPDQGSGSKANTTIKAETVIKSPKINQKNFKISDFLVKTVNGLNTLTPTKNESTPNKENSYLTYIGNEDSRLKLYDIADKSYGATIQPGGRPQSMSVTRRGDEET